MKIYLTRTETDELAMLMGTTIDRHDITGTDGSQTLVCLALGDVQRRLQYKLLQAPKPKVCVSLSMMEAHAIHLWRWHYMPPETPEGWLAKLHELGNCTALWLTNPHLPFALWKGGPRQPSKPKRLL